MANFDEISDANSVAIIGMSGRFPGAQDVEKFWKNLKEGVESIHFFEDEELIKAGVNPEFLGNPNYVKAATVVKDIDLFDANFFGFTPREAELTDPQHRLLLECAWEAIELAGYDTQTYPGKIGIFAGASVNAYLLFNLLPNIDRAEQGDVLATLMQNQHDFLATRISYELNLRGPSVNVQTACSTSLVAVHLACQSLLTGESDIVLAGGSAINVPHEAGYFYQKDSILSPDGHCRAFDASAQGTIDGNGVSVVVLKRLENAIADRDHIYAVIKGSAINNDGSVKVGYTAPSVDGQMDAIAEAIAMADIEPETISYIETHGTGTALGDPIEIKALTNVFQQYTDKTGFCAIGSVKTNVGHMDAASGVTSLIKASLALKHQLLPPSLHYEQPNPEIDFENSPFFVNTQLTPWPAQDTPRRAGVSSFGIGGTNVHLVIEEPPTLVSAPPSSRPHQLILLSAKSAPALDAMTQNLADYLQAHPQANLSDIAYTLQVGRTRFEHRRCLVCDTVEKTVQRLEKPSAQHLITHYAEAGEPGVVFMFPGQGSQYVNMARDLYHTESGFRDTVDSCAQLLQPTLNLDIRTILYPSSEETPDTAAQQLKQTAMAQPALFVIEYALAKQWMEWGIMPEAMIGHSLGEYVAACLSGVISLEDALRIVAVRARLMQQQPAGSMVAVSMPHQELEPMLDDALSLAAINTPDLCVVSGPTEAIEQLIALLEQQGTDATRLHTSHAFHSAMMDPVVDALVAQLQAVELQPPTIPFISTVTGTWITDADATSPQYWANHLRRTVRFSEGISTVLQKSKQVFLEVGPGRTLSTLTKRHAAASDKTVLTSLHPPKEYQPDVSFLLNTLGQLWATGVSIDWSAFHGAEQHNRLPLPTYPFERQRYWIEAQVGSMSDNGAESKSVSMPKPLHARPLLKSDYAAPSSEMEKELVDIWQNLLGIQQIGIYDNFFELGGHSLLATQLLAKVTKVFLVELSLQQLIDAPTIAEFAIVIQQALLEAMEKMSEADAQKLLAKLA
ncbi:MAG: beta-ketoacyl synthase N-terminal-like domain-containing protein [Cyanobacteria bacterium P01_F01_bin.150]